MEIRNSFTVLAQIEKWHKSTWQGLVVFAVAEFCLAYVFASLAIPTAHTWQWALAAIFALGVVRNLGLLIYKITHELKAKATRAR